MQHEMKLQPSPYAKIKSGAKTIELRLYDEKRQQIQVGDAIVFSNTEIPELKLTTEVVALHKFRTFAELFEEMPFDKCGFSSDMTTADAVDEMRQYYSSEQEAKYGVIGIEIKLVDEADDWTVCCNNGTFDANAFVSRMERIKQGEDTLCPFCGGTVGLVLDKDGHTVFGCDCCDMTIELESK